MRRIDFGADVLEWASTDGRTAYEDRALDGDWQAYCPQCVADRRFDVVLLSRPDDPPRVVPGPVYPPQAGGGAAPTVAVLAARKVVPGVAAGGAAAGGKSLTDDDRKALRKSALRTPWLFTGRCGQCHAAFVGLLYRHARQHAYVFLPASPGGLATPHAPAAVAYYLDQAHRAANIGAQSAAVAMYRAALEQLLFEQGYRDGMLHAKVTKLESDVSAGGGPAWARDLDPAFLHVVKELGNSAVHPNGGEIAKQDALDAQLVRAVRETFVELLDRIYEEPHRRGARLAALRAVADQMRMK